MGVLGLFLRPSNFYPPLFRLEVVGSVNQGSQFFVRS